MKILNIILTVALVVAIVYGFVISTDISALKAKLESVEAVLASTQAELNATKRTLTSVRTELGSTKQTLTSTQVELNSTKQTLVSIQNELEDTKAELRLYKETLGVKVSSGIQPPYEKEAFGRALDINLINNQNAINPTWQELKEFLLVDPTDDKIYRENIFDCGNFSEMLHNNAEAAGIKAMFVAVFFEDREIGHALNAFKTTDRGLVYVDVTTGTEEWKYGRGDAAERDKIAYLVKGKEYNSISLGENTPLDYDSYEKMKADWDIYYQKLELYNDEVEEFNREVSGNVYTIWNFEEWMQMKSWERSLEAQSRELDNLRAQLEVMWIPLGIVTNFEIYW